MAKLLLVEDDNNLREIYEARLQAEGYEIVSAKDGEEALVVAKAEKPDLIISDVMMPKISGFEMLDILRNTDGLKDVKVIMLTALGQSDDQQRADKLGADRYLVKSQVTLEDITKAAHELLGDAPPEAAAPAEQPAPVAAVPAEPVAAAPAEPATPVTVTEAPAETPAAVAEPAQSTAQEEASVESKIENFVAGATDEPTTAPEPAPASATEVADDKIMANAVQDLVASTPEQPETVPAPEPGIDDPDPEPVPKPATDTAPETPPASTTDRVVITPITDEDPKPDINELAAAEEAKEAAEAAQAKPAGGVDPNSIAL